MLKLIIVGYGIMGKLMEQAVKEHEDIEIMGICGRTGKMPCIKDVNRRADVVIDFSAPSSIYDIAEYCQKYKVPLVSAVTGYSEGQEKLIEKLSRIVPVFRSSNFSVGISVMKKLVHKATEMLEWDVEMIEKHHNKKKDFPSGTALMHEKSIGSNVTIHSVRVGNIPGEHTVIFAGNDEIIEITHRAFSKKIFAEGAIKAARFIVMQTAGMYGMEDIL